jgi:hypothetical protein
MNSNDLIRKLYDEGADPRDLEKDLGEESRAELRKIVEAKEVLEGLPRRGPSASTISAILEEAGSTRTGAPRLSLLISPRFVQRFAAAAAVLIVAGIGYLTVTSNSAEIGIEEAELAYEQDPSDEMAKSESAERVLRSPEPSAESPAPALAERQDVEAPREGLAAETPREELFDTLEPKRSAKPGMSAYGARGILAGADRDGDDNLGATYWEDDEPFQTFYWQVEALSRRSPDDGWEEAVPLEGSFRQADSTRGRILFTEPAPDE